MSEPFDSFTARMGNPNWGPWGEDRIAITPTHALYYERRFRESTHPATAALTPTGAARLVDALRAWPFAEPAPLVNIPPDSTFMDLTVTRGGVEVTRTVVYDAACKLPGYGPLLTLLYRWFAALRPPARKRIDASDDLVDIVDVAT